MGGRLGQIWLPCPPLIPRVFPPSVCPSPLKSLSNCPTSQSLLRLVPDLIFYFFSGLPGIWDFTFLTKNGTLPSFIGSVESSPLDHQGSLGAFIWEALPQVALQGYPRLHSLNSRLLSKPHRWPFHLTSIYSLTIALADLCILEEESRPSFKSINNNYGVRLLWHHMQ